MTPDIVGDRTDQEPEDERYSPSPAFQLIGGQRTRQHDTERGGENRGQALAGELPAGEETAAIGILLRQKRRRTAELATRREALQHARDHDHDRRSDADGRIGRHDGDDRRADHHDGDGEHEGNLAPIAIGEASEHDGTKRSQDEGDSERGQRQQQRRRLVVGRKEELRHGDGKEAVHHEVEPFERVADGGSGHSAPALPVAGR